MQTVEPKLQHYFGGNVYAKETVIPAGFVLVQHAHKHDHLSVLASGSVEMSVDNVKSILHAPACINIPANKHHGVKSLTDVVWYCIHATDCIDVAAIDEVLIVPANATKVKELVSSLQE